MMKPVLATIAAAILLALGLQLQSQTNADQETRVQKSAEALIKAHSGWKMNLGHSGVSIEAKQVAQQGSYVQYHIFVSGLPTDVNYTVLQWPVTKPQPIPAIEGASLGKNGIVMCAGRTEEQCGNRSKPDDPIEFTFNPAKGEPFRLALVSGENRATIVIVPDPISGKDKGCTLSVERLLPHFELAYISGSGFPPDTEINFDSHSYSEQHPLQAKTDSTGNLHFGMLPFVAGHKKGMTAVKAVGTTCSPFLKFDWGQ
jgi:hypothetical protein